VKANKIEAFSILRTKIFLIILVLLATISLSTACRSESAHTVSTQTTRETTDDLGRKIKVPAKIERVISLAGGNAGLQNRIAAQGEALSALGATLGEAELDTLLPTLLLSNGTVLVDQPVSLRDLITGLAEVELPGHTTQILALLTDGTDATASTRRAEAGRPALR